MVPPALRWCFILHFLTDMVFAMPLMVAPVATLGALGWTPIDPAAARLVAAALFGIGAESWFGRDNSREGYQGMIRLKLVWSGAATLGLALSLGQGAPAAAGLFLALFGLFHGMWWYWHLRLKHKP